MCWIRCLYVCVCVPAQMHVSVGQMIQAESDNSQAMFRKMMEMGDEAANMQMEWRIAIKLIQENGGERMKGRWG